MKKYLNIKEVSKITGLKEHVIRYWDSINPKTNELRIQGISTKSKKGTRYFNKENLRKIENLKKIKSRMQGWQLSTFEESYKHKVKQGISLFKKKLLEE